MIADASSGPGPFIERGVRGNTVVTAKTGFQTFWGTKLKETRYQRGNEISVMWYPVPPLHKAGSEK